MSSTSSPECFHHVLETETCPFLELSNCERLIDLVLDLVHAAGVVVADVETDSDCTLK
jgi:hypothetical protein